MQSASPGRWARNHNRSDIKQIAHANYQIKCCFQCSLCFCTAETGITSKKAAKKQTFISIYSLPLVVARKFAALARDPFRFTVHIIRNANFYLNQNADTLLSQLDGRVLPKSASGPGSTSKEAAVIFHFTKEASFPSSPSPLHDKRSFPAKAENTIRGKYSISKAKQRFFSPPPRTSSLLLSFPSLTN